MGRDGSMYLLVENPKNVDQLGNPIPREERLIEANPPITDRSRLRPIHSIWVRRAVIDDANKVLYKREDSGTKFYYLRNSPPDHTMTEDKVLYVFVDTNMGAYKPLLLPT